MGDLPVAALVALPGVMVMRQPRQLIRQIRLTRKMKRCRNQSTHTSVAGVVGKVLARNHPGVRVASINLALTKERMRDRRLAEAEAGLERFLNFAGRNVTVTGQPVDLTQEEADPEMDTYWAQTWKWTRCNVCGNKDPDHTTSKCPRWKEPSCNFCLFRHVSPETKGSTDPRCEERGIPEPGNVWDWDPSQAQERKNYEAAQAAAAEAARENRNYSAGRDQIRKLQEEFEHFKASMKDRVAAEVAEKVAALEEKRSRGSRSMRRRF